MFKNAVILFIVLFSAVNASAFGPMRISVRTGLPEHVSTVGAAARYYADIIGYKLETVCPAPEKSEKIADEAISLFSRRNIVLPIEEAILNLLRQRYVLIVDNKSRLYAFDESRHKTADRIVYRGLRVSLCQLDLYSTENYKDIGPPF